MLLRAIMDMRIVDMRIAGKVEIGMWLKMMNWSKIRIFPCCNPLLSVRARQYLLIALSHCWSLCHGLHLHLHLRSRCSYSISQRETPGRLMLYRLVHLSVSSRYSSVWRSYISCEMS
jgi:hypothetical protein